MLLTKKQSLLTRKNNNNMIQQMKSRLILSHYFYEWIKKTKQKRNIGYKNVDIYIKISILYFILYSTFSLLI